MESDYDPNFQPPAPVVSINVSVPGGPRKVEIKALLDSGADISVLPLASVQQLNLRRVDIASAQGFGGEIQQVPVFAAEITLDRLHEWMGRVLSWQEPYAIRGRNVMNRWRIILDGPKGVVIVE